MEYCMVPLCYETGFSAAAPDNSQFITVATEAFIKQFLSPFSTEPEQTDQVPQARREQEAGWKAERGGL